MNGLKTLAKNRESQWHALSAHLAHIGHENVKVGSLDAPRTAHLFTFGPRG